ARGYGPRRPEDDDGLRVPQLSFDDFVERFTGVKRCVPPDAEAFLGEGLGEDSRRRPVVTRIRQEDVGPGHVPPVSSRAKSLDSPREMQTNKAVRDSRGVNGEFRLT